MSRKEKKLQDKEKKSSGTAIRDRLQSRRKRGKLSADALILSPESEKNIQKLAANEKRLKSSKSTYIKSTDIIRVKGRPDMIMLVLVAILTLFGLVMDFSASYAYAHTAYGNSYMYIEDQVKYAAVGLVLMTILIFIDYNRLIKRFTLLAYIVTLALLGAVLVYGMAKGDAQRWIMIAGFSVQPSEIAKLTVVLILALYISRNSDRIVNYRNFRQSTLYGIIFPGIILAIPCAMIIAENHFSGTIIVGLIGVVMIYVSGGRRDVLLILGAGAVVVVLILILASGYGAERIGMWLNPDAYDPKGKIWQTIQGKYAIGSGGLFGVGLGNSKQKYLFVSQPQNDYVFSIVCEELGFAGALLIIILFMLLMWRGFLAARKAPDTFSSLIAFGITTKLALQTMLNIAVVTTLIPNTGVALPFFSYGGSALIMQLVEMGVLLGISRYTYRENDPVIKAEE